MKRPTAVPVKKGKAGALTTCPMLAKYTSICEYLTTSVWDDGTPRERSKISVSCEDGNVLIALNDVDLKQSAYTSSTSLQDALALLDEALKASSVHWRPWKAGTRRK